MLGGDKGRNVLQAVGQQALLHLIIGAGGNLVDHGPGEGNLFFQVGQLVGADFAVLLPCTGNFQHSVLELFAVVGAVVHRNQGQRGAAGVIAVQAESCQTGHQMPASLWAVLHVGGHCCGQFAVGAAQGVALVGDGEGDHLQRGRFKNFLDPGRVLQQSEALGDGAHHFLFHAAVGAEGHSNGKIVVGAVAAGDDFVVVALAADDAGVALTGLDQALAQHCRENAEDVACAEVEPAGLGFGAACHSLRVKGGQMIAGPVFGLAQGCIIQFHGAYFFPSSLSSISHAPRMYMMPRARSYRP